ncbi:hypothetical protein BTA31_01545, partial [Bacillus haynesii]
FLDIYQRNNKINFRVKSKVDITKVLNSASEHETTKKDFIRCISKVDSFIKKLKVLLIDKNEKKDSDDHLRKELDKIFNLTHSKLARRTLQNFYALWHILSDINYEMVKHHRIELKKEVSSLFKYTKSIPYQDSFGLEKYKEMVSCLLKKFEIDDRKIKLTLDEKKNLLNKQNNCCPICLADLFINDEIEVDHINPLAKGGKDKFLNLQITHKGCNRKKGVNV